MVCYRVIVLLGIPLVGSKSGNRAPLNDTYGRCRFTHVCSGANWQIMKKRGTMILIHAVKTEDFELSIHSCDFRL